MFGDLPVRRRMWRGFARTEELYGGELSTVGAGSCACVQCGIPAAAYLRGELQCVVDGGSVRRLRCICTRIVHTGRIHGVFVVGVFVGFAWVCVRFVIVCMRVEVGVGCVRSVRCGQLCDAGCDGPLVHGGSGARWLFVGECDGSYACCDGCVALH